MPDITQNVLIEFITDDSQLKSSTEVLEQQGLIEKKNADAFKATNAEIIKQQKALSDIGNITKQIDATGKVTKKNLLDIANAIKGQSKEFQNEIKRGVIDQLQKAGLSAKEFEKMLSGAMGTTEQATLSLRSKLREMTEQLAQMKVNGEATSQQYLDLAKKAGILKDAIGDANKEIQGFASDTSTFDGLLSVTSGIAGGFAVAQGAAALFGDESEELQKTLLRVNAAMAILQGLQQIQNVLQKESAASQLANSIATKVQAAALVFWNFVVGTSVGLLKIFRIALAATGVGLLVLGILELVKVFKSSNNAMEEANKLIEDQKNLLEGLNEVIQQSTDVEVARLKAASAAESTIITAQGRALVRQRNALRETNRRLSEQQDTLSATSKAWFKLNEEIEANADKLRSLDTQIIVTDINLTKQLADERREAEKQRRDDAKAAADEAKRRREEQLQKEKEARAAGFADFKAGIELQLLETKKGSEQELELKKKLLLAELQIALDNEKLTDNQRKLLIQNYFKARLAQQKQFETDATKSSLENTASFIQAELQQLELSNEDKLRLTEDALIIQAKMEVDAAEGNSIKIKEINAKRDKAIRDARIASIQEVLNYELAVGQVSNAANVRFLNDRLADDKTSLKEKKSIIDELTRIELEAIQKRIDALNEERGKTDDKGERLISLKDYNLQFAQLTDEQKKIWEDAEKKKTDSTKSEGRRRGDQLKEDIENVAKVAQIVSDVLSGLSDIANQRGEQRITDERKRLQELRDAGAITEKQAIERERRIDQEEKRIKLQKAKRDKEIAIFNAVIATARGVAEAIPNVFLIALAAAVGAAQIAIIAARPLPKFGKGKNNSYEGLAEVGESGAELIQTGNKMYVAEKRQVVWLGKKDKVFNPQQTIAMLSKPKMSKEKNGHTIINNKGIEIDYEKLGEAVGRHTQQNIYVDGVQEQQVRKNQFLNYLNTRRNF